MKVYQLENTNGISMRFMNYGATVIAIETPDSRGEMDNIILSLPTPHDYTKEKTYLGATIGRVAGRIRVGEWTFPLEKNEGDNHCHGGTIGFESRFWDGEPFQEETRVGVRFTYHSPAFENGYPGNLTATVCHSLDHENNWRTTYTATTDATTLFNPTNHVYFNLAGSKENTIHNHTLTIQSDAYLPLTAENLPTGEIKNVQNTPFDLRTATPLQAVLASNHRDIQQSQGLNHPFILNNQQHSAATLTHPDTGRQISIITTAPAVIAYTGNHFNQDFTLSTGQKVTKYAGIALETQQLPDAIHHPNFGNIILQPDQPFYSETTYQFSLK
ncbi:aldose epimerase family protein [Listeria booriae]|nr:Aldose 1-epimerase precursor [Listeria booriae]